MTKSSLPEIVYHYTSLPGLFGILESKALWASDLRYSNDATEAAYGRQEVLDRLVELNAELRRNPAPQRDEMPIDPGFFPGILDAIVAGQRSLSTDFYSMVFGVAFSRKGDQLSQWRGYAPGGCAIGVSHADLVKGYPALQLEHEFRAVHYGPGSFDTVYQEIQESVAPAGKTSADVEHDSAFEMRSRGFAGRALLTMKDEGFSEEDEVRLLLSIPGRFHGEGTDFKAEEGHPGARVNPSGLVVPYYSVPIHLSAIKKVIVSPGSDKERNVAALRRHFAATFTDFDPPEVLPSRIPLQ